MVSDIRRRDRSRDVSLGVSHFWPVLEKNSFETRSRGRVYFIARVLRYISTSCFTGLEISAIGGGFYRHRVALPEVPGSRHIGFRLLACLYGGFAILHPFKARRGARGR